MDYFLLPRSEQIKIGLFNQSFETQGNSISAKWNVISNDGSDRSFSCYPELIVRVPGYDREQD